MSPDMPAVPGVRHAEHDLPTGVKLHVAEAGDPAAPPLLLVHGWPQHWWAWRGVIPALAGTHRLVCPDLRGFGWSGQPADGDFTKERLADDLLALLDVLEIERAGWLGHDWGGWAGWLAALRAPERITRLMAVSVIAPWADRAATALQAWRMLYQWPLATPVVGPALVRDGRAPRRFLRGAMSDADAEVFVGVLREPARAAATSLLYRQFQLRELPALAGGRYEKARLQVPVKVLFPRSDGPQHPSQLRGLEAHCDAQVEVEVVEGTHLLLDEQPELVAERAAAWFG
jgi:pimeloyl-ACP methyl ester carboxylesterase